MRRACVRIGIRELSPYSFRHIAISTWSRAGLSPQEIARLCGHTSIRTAHTHYARAAAGHKRKAVARAEMVPDVERELGEVAAPAAAKEDKVHASQPPEPAFVFVLEDMPTPPARPGQGPEPLSPEAVAAAFSRYDQDMDANTLGQRIRDAQRRHRNPDPDDPGSDPRRDA
jgi:hypothetical protein